MYLIYSSNIIFLLISYIFIFLLIGQFNVFCSVPKKRKENRNNRVSIFIIIIISFISLEFIYYFYLLKWFHSNIVSINQSERLILWNENIVENGLQTINSYLLWINKTSSSISHFASGNRMSFLLRKGVDRLVLIINWQFSYFTHHNLFWLLLFEMK